MKPATNGPGGLLVDLLGRAALPDLAALHHRDAVGHRERLLLVVRDVEERDADLALDALQLHLHLLAQLQVERAERLVEQEHGGPVDERARQRHALLLPARQLARRRLLAAGQLHQLERLAHAGADLVLRDLAPLEPERHVVRDVQVLEQRVALEDRVHVALVRRHRLDRLALEVDVPRAGQLEAGDHAQRGGLAAPRRAEQREELALPDLEVELLDGLEVAERLVTPSNRMALMPLSLPEQYLEPALAAAEQARQQQREPDRRASR